MILNHANGKHKNKKHCDDHQSKKELFLTRDPNPKTGEDNANTVQSMQEDRRDNDPLTKFDERIFGQGKELIVSPWSLRQPTEDNQMQKQIKR